MKFILFGYVDSYREDATKCPRMEGILGHPFGMFLEIFTRLQIGMRLLAMIRAIFIGSFNYAILRLCTIVTGRELIGLIPPSFFTAGIPMYLKGMLPNWLSGMA